MVLLSVEAFGFVIVVFGCDFVCAFVCEGFGFRIVICYYI